jgi:hypothetical protein
MGEKTMARSLTIQFVRDEQREEMQKLSPAERLFMALELSDVCAELNEAGKKALEERHAAGAAEKV